MNMQSELNIASLNSLFCHCATDTPWQYFFASHNRFTDTEFPNRMIVYNNSITHNNIA